MVLLRKLRESKGFTMKELGEATEVNKVTINNIENLKYKRKSKSLDTLAKYFNIENPMDLMKNVDELLMQKKCLNKRCLLNKNCYCQSERVINGESCANQNMVSEPLKDVSFNNTTMLGR